MLVSPRLQHLLLLLLEREEPVAAGQLADSLGASTRTVFRELQNLDHLLAPYQLCLRTKTGVGISLEGEAAGRARLLGELREGRSGGQVDREERRKLLILELLRNREANKLYYYADRFKVSEATVSKDLDAVSPWFTSRGLSLLRRPGYGIALRGTEEDYRRALTEFIHENIDAQLLYEAVGRSDPPRTEDLGAGSIYRFLGREILDGVLETLDKCRDRQIAKMTEASYIGLVIHLAVAVERIQKRLGIEMDPAMLDRLRADPGYAAARRVTRALEERFHLTFPDEETAFLCVHIKGSKLQDTGEAADPALDHYKLTRMVYQMIDRFQADIAQELKRDDMLISGLVAHLLPTVTRLNHRLIIRNPLLDQVKELYPQVYRQSLEAAAVITEAVGLPVPEDEIGFLAIHFGAALVRLGSRKNRRRVVTICVVCASGIGISSMMCSRIKSIFRENVDVVPCAEEEFTAEMAGASDLVVSNYPLRLAGVDTLLVNPLLSDEDVDLLGREIGRLAHVKREGAGPARVQDDFTARLRQLKEAADSVLSLLERLDVCTLGAASTADEVLRIAGYRLGSCEEDGKQIYRDLLTREALGPVVVEQYGFVLFHAKTSGVGEPAFLVIMPEGDAFQAPAFQSAAALVVMLLPQRNSACHRGVMGRLSSALIEDDPFLRSIKSGAREEIRRQTERILRDYIVRLLDQV